MAQHDIEIEIKPDGKVRVHVKGAKGKACMEYAKWLESVVGSMQQQKLTSEYYEPEQTESVKLREKLGN